MVERLDAVAERGGRADAEATVTQVLEGAEMRRAGSAPAAGDRGGVGLELGPLLGEPVGALLVLVEQGALVSRPVTCGRRVEALLRRLVRRAGGVAVDRLRDGAAGLGRGVGVRAGPEGVLVAGSEVRSLRRPRRDRRNGGPAVIVADSVRSPASLRSPTSVRSPSPYPLRSPRSVSFAPTPSSTDESAPASCCAPGVLSPASRGSVDA